MPQMRFHTNNIEFAPLHEPASFCLWFYRTIRLADSFRSSVTVRHAQIFHTATMNASRFAALLALSLAEGLGAAMLLAAGARAQEREHNAWPGVVEHTDATGRSEGWTAGGPLVFKQPTPDPEGGTGTLSGFRPFWVQTAAANGERRSVWVLYPLFTYSADANTYRWTLLDLIRRTDHRADAPQPSSPLEPRGEFDIWPFWFSRQNGDPEASYRALFPVAGTLKHRLGFDRLSWLPFPLYVESETHGAVTTSTPWPFIRTTHGAAHGFALWPLFGWQERPGVSRDEFYLWPFAYNNTKQPAPDAPVGTPPARQVAVLPFYARATGPGSFSEDFLWPFFGHTEKTAPTRYHETRYLWPFLVQGRGDDRMINRWGPFYTHSTIKGYDKTWYLWPILRQSKWTEQGLAQTQIQVLWKIYWSLEQRSARHPELPAAEVRHIWPLYSGWDNGAGRRQWQVLSPFETFFPGNEKVRQTWTPLVALIRFDQRAPGDTHTSLLWNAVSWERRTSEGASEFHLGPLFSIATHTDERRIALGNGLLGWRRGPAGAGWRFFWLDFPPKPTTVPATPPAP